jgi:hypothetical protein
VLALFNDFGQNNAKAKYTDSWLMGLQQNAGSFPPSAGWFPQRKNVLPKCHVTRDLGGHTHWEAI